MKLFKYIILIFIGGCINPESEMDIFYTPPVNGQQSIYILDSNETILTDTFKSLYNAKEWHFIICTPIKAL